MDQRQVVWADPAARDQREAGRLGSGKVAAGITGGWHPGWGWVGFKFFTADGGSILVPGVVGIQRVHGKSGVHHGPHVPQVWAFRQELHPDADWQRLQRTGNYGGTDHRE